MIYNNKSEKGKTVEFFTNVEKLLEDVVVLHINNDASLVVNRDSKQYINLDGKELYRFDAVLYITLDNTLPEGGDIIIKHN